MKTHVEGSGLLNISSIDHRRSDKLEDRIAGVLALVSKLVYGLPVNSELLLRDKALRVSLLAALVQCALSAAASLAPWFTPSSAFEFFCGFFSF